MTSFVRIELAGAGSFAEMEIRAGDDIADVANRACAEFSHWGANAGQIALYLVDAVGDDLPPPSAVDSARHLDQIGWSLTRAGVSSGAWLVARKIADGGATSASRRTVFFLAFLTQTDGRLHSPQRGPYLLSPYAIGHVALSALQATHNWLAATVLRVGNIIFSAASGMENVGVPSPRRASPHESRVLDGRQPLDSNVGGHLPRRVLDFGLDSGESVGGGPLKEE
jgi:hypothetical protein